MTTLGQEKQEDITMAIMGIVKTLESLVSYIALGEYYIKLINNKLKKSGYKIVRIDDD